MNCPHWSPFGKGGLCAAKVHDRPSLGTCQRCPYSDGTPVPATFRVKMRNVTIKYTGQPCRGCGGKVIEFRQKA